MSCCKNKKQKKTLEELQYNKLCCWSIASSLGCRSRPHTVDDIMAWSADHDCTLLWFAKPMKPWTHNPWWPKRILFSARLFILFLVSLFLWLTMILGLTMIFFFKWGEIPLSTLIRRILWPSLRFATSGEADRGWLCLAPGHCQNL